jgi:hypothetical protein
VVGDSVPTNIEIPAAGGAETTVFEAGLRARGSEPPGTHPGETSFPTTTQTGTITFTSPDGVSKVELGGHVLTAAAQTFADGTTGLLTASFAYDPVTSQGVINYSYTLLDNTLGNPSSQSFEVAVTDADGDRTVGGDLLTIRVVDDGPVAIANTDTLGAGQVSTETGNVLTGSGTTSGAPDVRGADGAMQGVGLAAGDTGVNLVSPGQTFGVMGTFGSLSIFANGSYGYLRNGTPGGGTDVFTYTTSDADGSLSHATLTFQVEDAAPGNFDFSGATTTVFEAGLPPRGGLAPGSHFGDPSFPATTTGTISFRSVDGVGKVEFRGDLGGAVLTLASGTPQTFATLEWSLTASFHATAFGEYTTRSTFFTTHSALRPA